MRRRVRRWVEAAAVLLAFPAAVGLTVIAITSPSASGSTEAPSASSSSSSSSSVAIDGDEPFPTFALADRLRASGYDVVSVDTADAGNSLSAATVVVYYERNQQQAATAVRDLIGLGTTRRDQALEPDVDLTIILGKDFQRT
jgi:hypothetical protein